MKLTLILWSMAAILFFSGSALAMKHMDHDEDQEQEMSTGHHEMMEMEHDKMRDMDHDEMEDMDHGKKMGMEHGEKKGHDMKHDDDGMHESMGHAGHGGMRMLGEDVEEGVKVMSHIKVYDSQTQATMTKMGMRATHHFMVYFTDEQTGQPITTGTVAVKIEADEHEGEPIKLMPMGDGFGADITVPEGKEVKLKIGSKLADGKKRNFKVELKKP